ncbi:hypothetical protein IW140_005783 [Coemansia sp. RSA 1813]|nr:hypothetical protein EV178_005343 [Coemansia sp. RSA 1646]KAJ1768016.1 hypothetical protein LPJ74_005055 [Coemansia sp. RSA 1843]KAJ2086953.1 hypothetical protein IW138_005300 [Coemansia sp. RSA 986]KAJ2211765.1 hypothetical protein EV179_005202 [Coemansia sp. RSA 487]KAJ2564345.1 hypothetical protein IW140_005783 [Coemansia sp. RSA 1813]
MSPLQLFSRIKKATTKNSSSRQQPASALSPDVAADVTSRDAAFYDPSAQDIPVIGAPGSDIAAVFSLTNLYRTASSTSIDSQCTLVEPPNTLYITQSSGGGGGYRRHVPVNDGRRRPRSQFTIGPRRVIVCT